jgi:hypothetical protein
MFVMGIEGTWAKLRMMGAVQTLLESLVVSLVTTPLMDWPRSSDLAVATAGLVQSPMGLRRTMRRSLRTSHLLERAG